MKEGNLYKRGEILFYNKIGVDDLNFRTIDIEKDKDMIIKFRKDSYVVSFGTEEGFGDEIAYINRIRERVNKFPNGQVIIEEDNKPIGQMELQIQEFSGNEIGYVNLFYLIPEYRSKGLGKELICYAENFFRKSNVSEYHLRVSPDNQRAIRLYTKSGMVMVCEEDEEYLVWRMRKLL
ncbi:GNAT family N-acetyltransferase [Neobacillus sp. MER 74]|uniref:GNAT family N-acetyltransferase n=1 Tax=Neobacillus sp. MER 74 TaxID=2939566 RepID=UPI002040941D|nr:GNAT family N-acetyltransferase [Neobacillus sp. MER 74]MCM3118001.1 GNAT family N-acetyltransferase [Neobacillus sp. MER 74]